MLNGAATGLMLGAGINGFFSDWASAAGLAGIGMAFFIAGFFWGQQ